MLGDSIVLKDEAAANHTFVTVGSPNGTAITRIDQATTLSAPRKMVVSHSTSGSGLNLVDRHLIQFTEVELDAAGNPFTTIVNFTIARPRRATGNTTVYNLVSYLKDAIDTEGAHSALIDQILQGQS